MENLEPWFLTAHLAPLEKRWPFPRDDVWAARPLFLRACCTTN